MYYSREWGVGGLRPIKSVWDAASRGVRRACLGLTLPHPPCSTCTWLRETKCGWSKGWVVLFLHSALWSSGDGESRDEEESEESEDE